MIEFISSYIVYPVSYSLGFIMINLNLISFFVAFLSSIYIYRNHDESNKCAWKTLFIFLILMLIINFSPIPKLMIKHLEDLIPSKNFTQLSHEHFGEKDCLMLIGGSFSLFENQRSDGRIIHNLAAPRAYNFINLVRKFPKAKVIFSGNEMEYSSMKQLFNEAGIELGARLRYFPAVNTITHFNEGFEKYIQAQHIKKIVIGTSAFHMPRTLGLIKKAMNKTGTNTKVIPYSIDYHTAQKITVGSLMHDTFSERNNYQAFTVALKEYFALLNNRLKGYTTQILP